MLAQDVRMGLLSEPLSCSILGVLANKDRALLFLGLVCIKACP